MSNLLILMLSRKQADKHPRWQNLTKVELQLPWDQGQGEDYLKLFFNFNPDFANSFLTTLKAGGVNMITFKVDPATEPF